MKEPRRFWKLRSDVLGSVEDQRENDQEPSQHVQIFGVSIIEGIGITLHPVSHVNSAGSTAVFGLWRVGK